MTVLAAAFDYDPMIPFGKLEMRTEGGVLIERRETDDDDLYCHLLDSELQALCFAEVLGRRVHPAGADGFFVCDGCGRARCPRCAQIDAALPKRSSA